MSAIEIADLPRSVEAQQALTHSSHIDLKMPLLAKSAAGVSSSATAPWSMTRTCDVSDSAG